MMIMYQAKLEECMEENGWQYIEGALELEIKQFKTFDKIAEKSLEVSPETLNRKMVI